MSDEIVAFQRNKTSGSQVMMENLVMGGLEMAGAPTDYIVSEMEGLIKNVAGYNNSGNAIGYSVYYYFNNMYSLEGVRALEVNGVPCTNDTIRDGSYPYIQDFYAVIRRNEPANSNARKLFNFLMSGEGQDLIETAGYVALKSSGAGKAGAAIAGTVGDAAAAGSNERLSFDENIPLDTLSTIKRKPPVSFFGKLFGADDSQNLFPLVINNKTGFVNGNGELIIEPIYDTARGIGVYDGDRILHNFNTINNPMYYYAGNYGRDKNGAVDYDIFEHMTILGPSGQIIYESDNRDIIITSINLEDGSLLGYTGTDFDEFLYFIISNDGTINYLEPNIYTTDFIYSGKRLISRQENDECFLADLKGRRLFDITYGALETIGDDLFVFNKDDRLVAVDGSNEIVYSFPDDIIGLSWDKASGMYIYTSSKTVPDWDIATHFRGLMDRNFNKTTDASWLYIQETWNGDAFIAQELAAEDEGMPDTVYIIDKTGQKITKHGYNSIFGTMWYMYNSTNMSINRPEDFNTFCFLGYKYELSENGEYFSNSELIGINGEVIFYDNEDLAVDYLHGRYVSMRTMGDEYKVGLKFAADKSSLPSLENGWLIRPLYDYITDTGGGYLIAGMFANRFTKDMPAGESKVVYDTINRKIAFKGDYSRLNFMGYKNIDFKSGSNAGRDGIFYAETVARRGFVNSNGEWIVSLSRFDSLDMDD
jgi:hypothetical protein